MIANYGFEDGSGVFYISIDTSKCSNCVERGCVNGGCPADLFRLDVDDWENTNAVVKKEACNLIKTLCASCKAEENRPPLLPCQTACGLNAIQHSW